MNTFGTMNNFIIVYEKFISIETPSTKNAPLLKAVMCVVRIATGLLRWLPLREGVGVLWRSPFSRFASAGPGEDAVD